MTLMQKGWRTDQPNTGCNEAKICNYSVICSKEGFNNQDPKNLKCAHLCVICEIKKNKNDGEPTETNIWKLLAERKI